MDSTNRNRPLLILTLMHHIMMHPSLHYKQCTLQSPSFLSTVHRNRLNCQCQQFPLTLSPQLQLMCNCTTNYHPQFKFSDRKPFIHWHIFGMERPKPSCTMKWRRLKRPSETWPNIGEGLENYWENGGIFGSFSSQSSFREVCRRADWHWCCHFHSLCLIPLEFLEETFGMRWSSLLILQHLCVPDFSLRSWEESAVWLPLKLS
mmetsp:Transcript_11082/g.41376  ORF Transcript_11082/g.41376 Transcript_11082/m.41376 type:complete len:204 (+) Transcript_11082:1145-1756(+)